MASGTDDLLKKGDIRVSTWLVHAHMRAVSPCFKRVTVSSFRTAGGTSGLLPQRTSKVRPRRRMYSARLLCLVFGLLAYKALLQKADTQIASFLSLILVSRTMACCGCAAAWQCALCDAREQGQKSGPTL